MEAEMCSLDKYYVTISGISKEKETQMFNFFVSRDLTVIPRDETHDYGSYYGNHIQLEKSADQCNLEYNLAIWNPN